MIMMMMKELPVMAAGFLSWKRLGTRNWVNIYFQSLMFFGGGSFASLAIVVLLSLFYILCDVLGPYSVAS